SEHHSEMLKTKGYPEGLADLVRGYRLGDRVNLSFQLETSGRRAMLVLPVLSGPSIGVLANPLVCKALFLELCHRMKDRIIADVTLPPVISQLAVASFSSGGAYRNQFL